MSTTIPIPDDLEALLRSHAEQRQSTVEEVIREALEWYVRMDPELLDELSAWQDVRDEALDVTERSVEPGLCVKAGMKEPPGVSKVLNGQTLDSHKEARCDYTGCLAGIIRFSGQKAGGRGVLG